MQAVKRTLLPQGTGCFLFINLRDGGKTERNQMDEEAKKAAEAKAAEEAEAAKTKEAKTFTQEDLDRVAAERAKRAEEKFQKELKETLAKERADWERQTKLSQEEKDKEAREKAERELSEKENTLALRENRADTRELLAEKNIDSTLVDFVVDVDPAKTKENIELLEKAYAAAVKAGVDKALAGKTPEEKNNNKPSEPKYSGTTVI